MEFKNKERENNLCSTHTAMLCYRQPVADHAYDHTKRNSLDSAPNKGSNKGSHFPSQSQLLLQLFHISPRHRQVDSTNPDLTRSYFPPYTSVQTLTSAKVLGELPSSQEYTDDPLL